ncbi:MULTISPECIES: hypothetical protein [unclassified Chryseobacterium]|uniref:hypothetical protein n=1 Tax=unclassified Chryseobacterium TaxID=2593645 RepID=UPI001AE40A83|nr:MULTISPECIES: hypothetical protein [unclassified Chryseobacterium]MBP1167565.1 hypothetical protein [Chryseobacterium sp. PvR013]MDR4893110.1 hypothetical protein [Chryseobacterium sp. CFS7]
MLVGLSAVSKAQQGRVGINTTTPAATLDVVANTTDNARPDALLVPRMTAAELSSKDDTSGTYGAPQNGAIVYITSGTGTGARKVKITGPGFYYFDNSVPEWKPIGGSATAIGYTNVSQSTAINKNESMLVTTNVTIAAPAIATSVAGDKFRIVDATGGAGFSVTGVHSSTTTSPAVSGSALEYTFISGAWYCTSL